ncbi:MAG: sugar phosphate isomerase/epimerase [Chloroflexi bacterium]|nr:sugar phosphate isomerase/epimerase [Chloroflexota bacterium]
MRFGVCTWIFGDMPIDRIADTVAGMGYDGLELMGDLQAHRPDAIRAICRQTGLAVLSLTPENVDLAHPDAAIRRSALDYYRRLIDFAHDIGCPVVSCHGAVGRVRAIASQAEEYGYLLGGVAALAPRAAEAGVRIAMEVLNRYESHLLNTAAQAVEFVQAVAHPSVGILLDAYHMNIEESNPAQAIDHADGRLFLFHVADSNRAGLGLGHTDFPALAAALKRIGYAGDIIVECTASGPDPFTPVKGEGWREQLGEYLRRSREYLQQHFA